MSGPSVPGPEPGRCPGRAADPAHRPGPARSRGGDARQLGADWRGVQSGFVDDPCASVCDADALVGQAIEHLTSRLNERKRRIEAEWQVRGGADTERLRVVLREYRALLEQAAAAAPWPRPDQGRAAACGPAVSRRPKHSRVSPG